METTISSEIYWLTWNVVLTALMVLPYAVYRLNKIGGLWQAFLRPLPGDSPFDDEWAHRAYRAQMNAFEGITLFAPVAIAVHVTGVSNDVTAMASATFFWARFIYAPMYYFQVPVLRTAVWFVSLASTLTLAFQVLIKA